VRQRVVLVHDYLTQRGGAERVALALVRAFPDAPLYTSLFEPGGTFPEFREVDVRPLTVNRVVPIRRHHRLALPLLAAAFASKRVDADVAICSSSGWAHGIRTTGRKIVYCHSPAKWLHRADDYLAGRFGFGARLVSRLLAPGLRAFDHWAAASADVYVVNSTYIAGQVEQVYGITARVIPPAVGIDANGVREPVVGIEPGFFLTVARLMAYKNVAETVAAFRQLPDERLVVVGEGPERAALEAAAPRNVRFVGEVEDAQLRWLYAECDGLVCASREDFGLAPIEAAAFGRPTAGLRFGGFLDTVRDGETGAFFDTTNPVAIADAVRRLRSGKWDDALIRRHADGYREDRFARDIRALVDEVAGSG
jgi:glycosyltransferase involved in cell wall biosynthesis